MAKANWWLLLVSIKLVVLWLISYKARSFLPYLGLFSFPDILDRYQLSLLVKSSAFFDGIHYLRIAEEGYYAFAQAFFPLYPLAIQVFSLNGVWDRLLVGIGISCLCLMVSINLWDRLHQVLGVNFSLNWLLVFLFVFPTSFFLQSVYTESLFLCLVLATFVYLFDDEPEKAAVVSFFASLTRVTGVLLVIAFGVWFICRPHRRPARWWVWTVFPLLGLGVYSAYLYQTTGDGLAFLHAQTAFGAGRSTQLILLPQVYFRYAKIMLTATLDLAWWRSVLEVSFFSFALVITALHAWQSWQRRHGQLLTISIYSLAALLLPTFTGTFLSMPRFVVVCLPIYIWLAGLRSHLLKVGLAVFFAGLQVILWSFFSRGYFIS